MSSSFITSFGIFHRLIKNVGGNTYTLSVRGKIREDGSAKTHEIDYTIEDLGRLKDILLGEFAKDASEDQSSLVQQVIHDGYEVTDQIKIVDLTDGTEYFNANETIRLFSPRVVNGMKDGHKYVYYRCYKKAPGVPKLWLEFDPLAWLDANLTPAELNAALKKLNLV